MAIGTSLPEILTSAYASYMHAPGISIGNAIGSCICNIGLVLGVSAIISPIIVDKNLRKNIFVYLLFVIFTAVIGIDGFSWIDGVILLILFAIYLRWTVKNGNIEEINENNNKNNPSMVFSLVLLIIGLVGVLVGAELFVDGAKKIATALNVSDKIIGFTLVAFGTSVPELMVSLVAAKRNLGGMVLGNVVGSNIADIGGALALGSLFMYLPPENLQIAILTVMSFLLYLFAKYSKIGRWQGILFLIIYIIAIASLGMG
ncbi:Na+/Ca+ antiporter [Methanocaldococcus bathoardescens]|uniref:Na+/Ca+ antiporter n=2 Tax=Methanocaldococcus bathoardescens TaxID=1301915 RepID=A0A076LAY7_9EURY|nr:Na+/Ca+ antiporter [Methanocaldococcus bathoardescens]